MSLFNTIKTHQISARKAKEAIATDLLTTLIGEAGTVGKNKRNGDPTDEEVVQVVKSFLKNNKLSQDSVVDLSAKAVLQKEQELLEGYMPRQLTSKQLIWVVANKYHGQKFTKAEAMKFLKESFAGQYDGKMASEVIDGLIAQ